MEIMINAELIEWINNEIGAGTLASDDITVTEVVNALVRFALEIRQLAQSDVRVAINSNASTASTASTEE